jgi:hypothetical protein
MSLIYSMLMSVNGYEVMGRNQIASANKEL